MDNAFMDSAFGTFALRRYPHRQRSTLRAWDAADEYALQHVHDQQLIAGPGRWLVVNDSFGALGVALASQPGIEVQSWSDSYLSHQGLANNLAANGLAADGMSPGVVSVQSVEEPAGPLAGVIIKVPKTLALLENQLRRFRPHIGDDTVVLGAGMVKHIHTSTLELFGSIIGATTTSLARKKARLIHPLLDAAPDASLPANPFPSRYRLGAAPQPNLQVVNHANVFSRGKLDVGTRFLLEHLPATSGDMSVIDLGCGNGVVGACVLAANPAAQVTFVDESYMAVESARETAGPVGAATFVVTNILDGVADSSADLILNNPPFHDQHAVGDAVAWDMFTEARRVLRPGGQLLVVGNRHLGYHSKLRKRFGNAEVVASNKKFVIVRSERRSR